MGSRPLTVIVLAAGQGTRMKSRRAKVLHELCGRPLLGHVLESVAPLEPERLHVVVGRDADQVQEAFAGRAEFVLQAEQRGTGHAVAQVEPRLRDFEGDVLVLYADVPLLRTASLLRMRALRERSGADLVMLTSPEPLPGIVVRDAAGRVERIIERPDATPEQLRIQEGNTGVYLLDAALLREGLASLDDHNAQGELYLTDVVGFAVRKGYRVEALRLEDPEECLGINTRAELARAGAVLRRRKLDALMEAGVTIVDPQSTWVDVQVEIGRDTRIAPGCVIEGDTVIGEGVEVKAHCTIESSRLDDDVVIGPSAHLRPGSRLGRGVRIGNFVEVKNSVLGPGVKADHLSYIGDADVGEGSSFGCGSITVNYDWSRKHRTRIGRDVRIGCNANLIAPIAIGDGVAVAAGSTLAQDVPAGALAVARARQRNVEGWAARGAATPRPAQAGARTVGSGPASIQEPAREEPLARAKKAARKKSAAPKAARKKRARKKAAAPKAARKKAARKKSAAPKAARKKAARKKAARKKAAAPKAARKKAAAPKARAGKGVAQRRRRG